MVRCRSRTAACAEAGGRWGGWSGPPRRHHRKTSSGGDDVLYCRVMPTNPNDPIARMDGNSSRLARRGNWPGKYLSLDCDFTCAAPLEATTFPYDKRACRPVVHGDR